MKIAGQHPDTLPNFFLQPSHKRSWIGWAIEQDDGENYGLFFLFYSFSTTPPLDYHSHPGLKDALSLYGATSPRLCLTRSNSSIIGAIIQLPETMNRSLDLLIIFLHVSYIIIFSKMFEYCRYFLLTAYSTWSPVFSSWRWRPQPLCSPTFSSPESPS